jgi:hypothetical protein
MQTRASACNPQTLRRLQSIFDAVWRELEKQKGLHTFPWAIEATRFNVARQVLGHMTDRRDPERIKQEVLESITNSHRGLTSKRGATKDDTQLERHAGA